CARRCSQVVNVFAILALVPLATRLTHNRWASVGVVLLAGLLFHMPNMYSDWGRYSQLARAHSSRTIGCRTTSPCSA
ncbi:MAG: hypothetical protein ABI874_03270, partial [Chloroflexota bacterium]